LPIYGRVSFKPFLSLKCKENQGNSQLKEAKFFNLAYGFLSWKVCGASFFRCCIIKVCEEEFMPTFIAVHKWKPEEQIKVFVW